MRRGNQPAVDAASLRSLEVLRGVDTPTIANAIEAFLVRDRTTGYTDCNIRCLFPELGPMVGFAVTARIDGTRAGEPPGWGVLFEFWQLVHRANKPVVIAFEHVQHDVARADVFGDVMANVGRRLGAVGLVTNACVRDLGGLREMRFHCFARGAVVSHGNFNVVSVGLPVVIGGLRIATGDLLHADENGVVLIPAGVTLEALNREVDRVREEDRHRIALANSADFTLDTVRRDLDAHAP